MNPHIDVIVSVRQPNKKMSLLFSFSFSPSFSFSFFLNDHNKLENIREKEKHGFNFMFQLKCSRHMSTKSGITEKTATHILMFDFGLCLCCTVSCGCLIGSFCKQSVLIKLVLESN